MHLDEWKGGEEIKSGKWAWTESDVLPGSDERVALVSSSIASIHVPILLTYMLLELERDI